MEIRRPPIPGKPTACGRLLCATLAAVAAGLLLPHAATADLPGARLNPEAHPHDRKQNETPPIALQRAAAAYIATVPPEIRGPVVSLTQVLARVASQELQARFWFNDRNTKAVGATQVAGARTPFLAACMYLGGLEQRVWFTPPPTQAPPLDAAWLDGVTDRERAGKPFMNVGERAPDELWLPQFRAGYQEYLAYCQAVVYAARNPPDLFAKSAAENTHLGFVALYNNPARYRGKVVHMEGRLKRVLKFEALARVERQGVPWMYEGWVFLDRPGPPVVVIFTELPPGLKVGNYSRAPQVKFDGYFFKKYRYRSGEKDSRGNYKAMSTLLFIAPTLAKTAAPPRQEVISPLSGPIFYGVIGFVGLTVILVLIANLWYRKSDQAIRSRLRDLEGERFLHEGLPELGHESGELRGDGTHVGQERRSTPEIEAREKNGHPPGH